MTKASIRVKSNTVYEIEVNDNGDVISMDPADLNLYDSIYRMMDTIKNAEKQFNDESKKIEQLEESDEKTRKQVKCMIRYFNKGRKAIDLVYGEGAADKIFGKTNHIEMFDMFFEQMEPHMEKIGVNITEYQKRLVAKYGNRKARRNVLS